VAVSLTSVVVQKAVLLHVHGSPHRILIQDESGLWMRLSNLRKTFMGSLGDVVGSAASMISSGELHSRLLSSKDVFDVIANDLGYARLW